MIPPSNREQILRRIAVQAFADPRPQRHRAAKSLQTFDVPDPRLAHGEGGIAAAVHPLAHVADLAAAEVEREVLGAAEDGEEHAGLVPAALDVGDVEPNLGLADFPRGDGAFGGDRGAVAVIEVLAEARGEVAVVRGFASGRVGGRGETVDVADEVDGCGRGVGRAGFELFYDAVHDHDVLAVADPKPDRLADPDFLSAEIYAVVEALARHDGVVAYAFDERKAFVYGFCCEDAAVYFGISGAICTIQNFSPVNGIEGESCRGKGLVSWCGCTPCKPRSQEVLLRYDFKRRVAEWVG